MGGSLFDGMDPGPAGKEGPWFTAHCDGGSRGNPGPAGYGAVIENSQGIVVARLSEYLGSQTNNFAEYSGLIAVLKWATAGGARCLRVVSDSELLVKQMNGQYRVKNPGLIPLWNEARRLSRSLTAFQITHTLRAGNAEADRLANEAMDRGMGKGRDQATPASTNRSPGAPAGNKGPRDQEAREQGSGNRDQGSAARAQVPVQRAAPQAAKAERQVLEGYVKNGVVHLLEGELPDGIFVKVVRE